MKHRLGSPCPIRGGESISVMWSDPKRAEWPDNACALCTGDTRSISERLADLEAGRPTTLDNGLPKRVKDASEFRQ